MKKTLALFLVFTVFTSAVLYAQVRKVPAEVTDALKAKYPNATAVEWKDNISNFQATFSMDNTEWTAEFTGKGEWKESTKKMTFDALPAAVKDGFSKSKFNDWTPGTVTMIEKADKGVTYRIYVEKSSLVQKKFLYFNKDGQLEKEAAGI